MKKSTVVHCWRSKSDAVREDWEGDNPGREFVGSPEWFAINHPSWIDGVCRKAHEHVGPCEFDDGVAEKERKAS